MSQRRQIAARAYAALGRNKRRNPAVQHFAKSVDNFSPHSGKTFGKRIGAQQHHGADLGRGQWLAHPNRVRPHQINLHFPYLLARNAHVTEFAYASRNRIRNFVARDQGVHYRASPPNAGASIAIQKHGPSTDRHFAHRFGSKLIAVDVKCFQGICRSAFRNKYDSHSSAPIAARNALMYFSGRGTFFISGSTTMCVVSPSASSVPSSARTSSYSNCTRDSRMYFK